MADQHLPGKEESLWDHKPKWCQPWSILLTGVIAIALSWFALGLWWLTAAAVIAVSLWWMLFLVLVPRAWRQAVLEASARERPQATGCISPPPGVESSSSFSVRP